MKHNLSNVNDSGTNGLLVGCWNKWNWLLGICSGTHGKFTKEMKGLEVGMTLGLDVGTWKGSIICWARNLSIGHPPHTLEIFY